MVRIISPIENFSVITFDTLLSEGCRDREGWVHLCSFKTRSVPQCTSFSFGGSGLCWSFYVGTAIAKTRRGTLGYAAFFWKLNRCTQPSHYPRPLLSHESKVIMLRFSMDNAILNKPLMNLLISLARDVVVPPMIPTWIHPDSSHVICQPSW